MFSKFLRGGFFFACLSIIACGGKESFDFEKEPELDEVSSFAEEWRTETLSTPLESPHPYSNNATIERRIEAPAGALALRLQVEIRTERNYDVVEFLDGQGNVVQTFTGSGSGYTQDIPGRVATVRLKSDGSVTDWGFKVTAFRYKIDNSVPSTNWTRVNLPTFESAHPYANNTKKTWTIVGSAGATRLRIRFEQFETERNYDFAILKNGSGAEVARYHGTLAPFYSAEVPGDIATLELNTDGSINAYGFRAYAEELLDPNAGGCRSDADCASGEFCGPVTCIRAPCNNACQPRQTTGAGSGEACSMQSSNCNSGLVCHEEFNSALGGVCSAPTWSTETIDFPISTSHPYGNSEDRWFDVTGPEWAAKLKLMFEGYDTEANYDFTELVVDGATFKRYTGKLGAFTTDEVNGNSAALRFKSDFSVTAYGFDLRKLGVFGVPNRLVALSFDPLQCNSDRVPTDNAGLTQHLQNLGVAVYGIRRYQYTNTVCAACSCPTGERIVLLVNAEDVYAAKGLSRNTGIYSVQQGDNLYTGRLVEMRITPVQCGGNAWDQWCATARDPACGSTLDSRVKAWVNHIGASVYALHQRHVRQTVCLACNCPTTYDLHLGVPENHVSTFEARGFRTVR